MANTRAAEGWAPANTCEARHARPLTDPVLAALLGWAPLPVIREALADTSVVLLNEPRQAGKTTLA